MKTREETCIKGHSNGVVWGRGVAIQSGGIERRPGSGRDASHAWWWVHCTACDASELNPMPDYCGRYGSPFEVDLDYGEVRPDELFEGGVTDLWKYRALYPLSSHRMGSSSA